MNDDHDRDHEWLRRFSSHLSFLVLTINKKKYVKLIKIKKIKIKNQYVKKNKNNILKNLTNKLKNNN